MLLGFIHNLILNSTSIHEMRKKLRKEKHEAIKVQVPALFARSSNTLYLDRKLLTGLFHTDVVNRLAVLNSCENNEQV